MPNLKSLTTPTLISVLDAWIDPKAQRPAIEKLSRSAALLGDLEAARADLGATHAVDGKAPAALAKAQQKCAALDTEHDRIARGLDKGLDALAELAGDDDEATALRQARTEVLGKGGSAVVNWSYVDEATNTRLADERMSAATKKLLADTTLGDHTVAKWVKAWQAAGKALGEAEAERAAIEAKGSGDQKPADAVRARNKTIRAINAFLGLLDLDAPDDATRAALTGPLDAAIAKASKRAKPAAAEPVEPAPAPKPVG
jgi:hypothetical protein